MLRRLTPIFVLSIVACKNDPPGPAAWGEICDPQSSGKTQDCDLGLVCFAEDDEPEIGPSTDRRGLCFANCNDDADCQDSAGEWKCHFGTCVPLCAADQDCPADFDFPMACESYSEYDYCIIHR